MTEYIRLGDRVYDTESMIGSILKEQEERARDIRIVTGTADPSEVVELTPEREARAREVAANYAERMERRRRQAAGIEADRERFRARDEGRI